MIATLSEWKEFLNSNVYKDMTEDIDDRKEILTNKLIGGNDKDFADDNIRGRLSELDFIASMAKDIVALMEIEENKEHTNKMLNKLKGE